MILMDTNSSKIIYPRLSYALTGMCFSVHNELGPYCREKQYSDLLEIKLKEAGLNYRRECGVGDSGNILDFIVDDKIVIEVKAKRLLSKSDYYQAQRYLQQTKLRLALLVNFQNRYVKPVRVIRIDSQNSKKYGGAD
ncbi:MAG: hypothetical protein COU10_00360 [Candidatus Harrisonbacteria bacterium CG10_big_fil_rev_8_21_14_0_10_45_28]|uniref:GxxExxY protein n=1 Tax=Candidatus Harrisonbacteria bacterium CG10_big_fil_rev_8_21_14_0_10_45_28 TaxID=1974586 RepID=A0A2H0UPA9_9BACT|nr:MAG: hypothetical protein COU10_00360 [Candidatus Harrisonbacteria bacterium CG10_big_fil_rev_8_21_14_0_10_45_28]